MLTLLQNKWIRIGLPFFIFVIGGSVGVREFTKLRYEYSKGTKFHEEIKKAGFELKPAETSIEVEYEKIKNMDINSWENKRIPRPWE